MKWFDKLDKIRVFAWTEFVIWLIIVSVIVFGIKYYHHKTQKQYKTYQIFMEDVDGLIVGSPVKFLGTQIGYVKKIQIISTEVYIKFAITEKDLVLPTGAVATVEASGLGGSKALEIYPPDELNPTDKIIAVKEPTRLNQVVGLFDHLFKELDAIVTTLNDSASQFEFTSSGKVPNDIISPVEANSKLDKVNDNIDNIMIIKSKFMKNLNKDKEKADES